MKTTPFLAAFLAAHFLIMAPHLSAQSTFLEGYSARLSWPEVENLIPKRPEIKEFLADGDYVTYVMVYHPAAAELVRRVHPGAVLEESFASPELEVKARQMAVVMVDKNPRLKESLYGEGKPEAIAEKREALTAEEIREREAALKHDPAAQEVPSDLRGMDAATLHAKLADLKTLWNGASDDHERASLEREMRLIESILKNRKP